MPKIRWDIAKILLALFVVWQILMSLLLPYVSDVTVSKLGDSAQPEAIELPYFHRSLPGNTPLNITYVFSMRVHGSMVSSAKIRIIPDDCIELLKFNYNMIFVPPEQRCNLNKGFVVDLKDYWGQGDNTLEVQVLDKAVRYGLTIEPVLGDGWQPSLQRFISLFLLMGALYAFVLRRLAFDKTIISAALVCLFASVHMVQHSDFTNRAPDWWGHIEYIRYVANRWSVPAPMAGWEFYQQPLYYFVAALVGKIGAFASVPLVFTARYLSLVFMMTFVVYGLLIIRTVISDKKVALLCSLLLLFWPFFLEIAGRLNNDMLLYPLWAACYYYLLLWSCQREPKRLAQALSLCAVMLITKTSGIVPLATIILSVWVTTRKPLGGYAKNRMVWKGAIAVVVALAWNFGRTLYYQAHNSQLAIIISNSNMNRYMAAQYSDNSLWKFLSINPHILFTNAFTTYTDDATGRHYFWQTYFKSLLFGYDSWPFTSLAIAMNCVFLLLVIYTIAASFTQKLSRDQKFLALCIAVALASQIGIRLLNRETGTNDARMTFPVLLVFIAYVGTLMQPRDGKTGVVAYTGYALCAGFLAMSAVLMVLITF